MISVHLYNILYTLLNYGVGSSPGLRVNKSIRLLPYLPRSLLLDRVNLSLLCLCLHHLHTVIKYWWRRYLEVEGWSVAEKMVGRWAGLGLVPQRCLLSRGHIDNNGYLKEEFMLDRSVLSCCRRRRDFGRWNLRQCGWNIRRGNKLFSLFDKVCPALPHNILSCAPIIVQPIKIQTVRKLDG